MHKNILATVGLLAVLNSDQVLAQDSSPAQRFSDANQPERNRMSMDATKFAVWTGEELAQHAAAYRKETDVHRLNAMQVAEMARTGTLPPGTGARIRSALESDLNLWREALQVNNRDWNAMRKQWLVPVASLTDQQWAQQRANWFVARDAWIDDRLGRAAGNRP